MWLVKPAIVVVVLWYLDKSKDWAAATAASNATLGFQNFGMSAAELLCRFKATFGGGSKWIPDPNNNFAASKGNGGYCSSGGDVQITDTPGVDGPITSPSQVA